MDLVAVQQMGEEKPIKAEKRIWPRWFIRSAGMLLFITAFAKLISSFGSARILQSDDPILLLPFRDVFWITAVLELAAAFICLATKRLGLQVALVMWLSSGFLIYRLGLLLIGYRQPCSCLGNLTDALRIPPQTADTMMKCILGYLLIGSYAAMYLFCQDRRRQRE